MPETHDKDKIESLLKSNDEQTIIDAIMYMTFNINDPEWIQNKCSEQINAKKSNNITELSITCLGHVARIHRTINMNTTIPLLNKLLKTKEFSGHARDALDDIEQFAKKNKTQP